MGAYMHTYTTYSMACTVYVKQASMQGDAHPHAPPSARSSQGTLRNGGGGDDLLSNTALGLGYFPQQGEGRRNRGCVWVVGHVVKAFGTSLLTLYKQRPRYQSFTPATPLQCYVPCSFAHRFLSLSLPPAEMPVCPHYSHVNANQRTQTRRESQPVSILTKQNSLSAHGRELTNLGSGGIQQ